MQKGNSHPLKWLFHQCKTQQWMLWFAILFSLTAAVLALGPYYVVYLIVDKLIAGEGWDQLWSLSIIVLFIMVARYLSLLISVYLAHHCAFHIQYNIRHSVVNRLSKTRLGFFSRKNSGELKKNLTEDIDRIEVFIAHQLPDLVSSFIIPLATFILLMVIDVRMALIALVPIPLAILCQAVLFKDYQSKAEQYHESVEKLNSSVTEFIRAMPVVRLFGIGERSYNQLDNDIQHHKNYIESWTKSAGWPFALFKIVLSSGLVFLVPSGLYFWFQGSLSVSSFLLCILLGVGMLEPLFNLTLLSTYLGQVFEGVARLIKIVNLPRMEDTASQSEMRHHDIEFNSVDFCYEGKQQKAINNVSFTVPSGSLTAIVGHSGAGKTTLASLLAGFWPVAGGEILIGGQSLSKMSEAQRMDAIAMVDQDSFVFTQSVSSNLSMGKDYSMEAIVAAAKAANAHDFISQLPNGYDTVIGKDTRLSGGQKQRLSIARAILKDAPIIILDEPTSHSDATNQKLIQSALSKLMTGKTVIIIAHRLATIQRADQILVMDDGKLIEQGKHDQLVALNGLYGSMWRKSQKTQNWSVTNKAKHEEMGCA
ncbi:ABC transporter ATP-binding protein/permease [Vibrio sp. Of7-15]|uniref:ABC transporter ATP-binding protein n=1 Tax=Vibrio sp. Of7-15 TaxID=2724879 RepID=UPI001EF19165|nr:ABC transporter ATP-binding protein [Vibrio sp. Of7-15]MCG7497363.1 ABC transporter ATP-binding protein/permease [Vibrio sp. Of7-15]